MDPETQTDLELLRLSQNGDREAQEGLFHKYRKASHEGTKLFMCFNKYYLKYIDEYRSEADMILFVSIPKYDPKKGEDQHKFYVYEVRNKLKDYTRGHYHPGGIFYSKKNKKKIDASDLKETSSNYLPYVAAPLDDPAPSESVALLLANCRNDRERSVLEMSFGVNGSPLMTAAEIGRVLRISGQLVRETKLSAMKRLAKTYSHLVA